MNPRKMGAPAVNDTSIVDDFGTEERVLDSPIEPSEMFPPESRQTTVAQRPALLDFGELPLRQSPAHATTGTAARLRPRRSVIRFVVTGAIAAASIALALIAGAAVRNRLDVSALWDRIATTVSNYVAVDQTSTPAQPEVRPVAEVARDSAPASTTGTTDRRLPTVATTRSVPKRESLPAPRPPVSSARTATTASRPAPSSLPPPVERRVESSPPPPARTEAISPPAAPVVSTPPALPAVTSAAPVAAPSPALPPPAPASAPSPAPAAAPRATPAAAPSAAPSAAASAAPVAGMTTETRAVAVALDRYQDAFSALDVNGVHAVWPGVDVRALSKAFDQLEEQTFDLEACAISVAGAQAEADCTGNARYIRKVGNRALRVEPRRWHFKLRQQTNNQWVIDTVDAH